jgi:hypothetical protein
VIPEHRIENLSRALSAKACLLHDQSKFVESRAVFEENCNMLISKYHPEHPLVLKAMHHLIESLILTEEYYDAER